MIDNFLVEMKEKYNVNSMIALNVYNSCMDYFIYTSKEGLVNYDEIGIMAERFIIPLDQIQVYKK